MKTDLDSRERDELRRALAAMEDQAPPAPDLDVVSLSPASSRRTSAWVAAAAVAVTALAVGVPLLLAGGGDRRVASAPGEDWDIHVVFDETFDVDELVDAVTAVDGVSTVEYVPEAERAPEPEGTVTDPTGAVATTAAGNPSAEDEAPVGTLLIRLGMGADAADVAAHVTALRPGLHAEFSPDVAARDLSLWLAAAEQGAEVVLDDPTVIQPALGPEPAFDADALGTEVVLERPGDRDALRRELPAASSKALPPLVHIGRLAETETRLVVYTTADGWTCRAEVDPGGGGAGCDVGLNASFGAVGGGGVVDDSGVGVRHVVVRVPADTAVATLSIDGGPAQWQRPAAGLALFADPLYDGEDSDTVVIAYDAAGNVIGSWVRTV